MSKRNFTTENGDSNPAQFEDAKPAAFPSLNIESIHSSLEDISSSSSSPFQTPHQVPRGLSTLNLSPPPRPPRRSPVTSKTTSSTPSRSQLESPPTTDSESDLEDYYSNLPVFGRTLFTSPIRPSRPFTTLSSSYPISPPSSFDFPTPPQSSHSSNSIRSKSRSSSMTSSTQSLMVLAPTSSIPRVRTKRQLSLSVSTDPQRDLDLFYLNDVGRDNDKNDDLIEEVSDWPNYAYVRAPKSKKEQEEDEEELRRRTKALPQLPIKPRTRHEPEAVRRIHFRADAVRLPEEERSTGRRQSELEVADWDELFDVVQETKGYRGKSSLGRAFSFSCKNSGNTRASSVLRRTKK